MKNSRNARFQRGTGCYPCDVCGRQTRATGNQSMGSKLCTECWEIAGYENQLSDSGEKSFDEDEKNTVRGYITALEEKGGSAAAVAEAKSVFSFLYETPAPVAVSAPKPSAAEQALVYFEKNLARDVEQAAKTYADAVTSLLQYAQRAADELEDSTLALNVGQFGARVVETRAKWDALKTQQRQLRDALSFAGV